MTEGMTGMWPLVGLATFLAQSAPGDFSMLGVPPIGGYLSIFKILGMFVLVIPWLLAAPWVHKDSAYVRAPRAVWGSVLLGVGAGAFLIWLLLPVYFIGLVVYVLAVSSVLISYLVYRNSRVSDEEKIQLSALFRRPQRATERPLTRLSIYGAKGSVVMEPGEEIEAEEVHTYNLVQELVYDMVWRRASEADLAPVGEQARVQFVIDGVVVDRPPRTLGESESIIQYLKPVAGMDAEDRRRPQKGTISVDLAGNQTEIDLTTAGTTGGQRMQFRVVEEFVQTRLDELGMPTEILERIRALNKMANGMIIISGRRGSGVTSTLYSLLREHDAFIRQLVTLEAKVEVELENITQHAYGQDSKLSHSLASALRRDPDVIMVDNCRNHESASLVLRAGKEKFVLVGTEAGDSFTALAKWVKVCSGQAAAISNLHGVLCQMLVRKLCPECREPYRPDPQLLAKANIPSDRVEMFYRPSGKLVDQKGQVQVCHYCQGSGYFGRMATFELLEMTDELKQMVTVGSTLTQIKAAARKKKMLYLQEQALQKVIAGETSIQEVIRVSQAKK